MPRLTFESLRKEAKSRKLLLERICRTSKGECQRYEVTDQATGVWERFATLEAARQAIAEWADQERFFIVPA